MSRENSYWAYDQPVCMIEVADANATYYYPSTMLRMVSLSNHHFDAPFDCAFGCAQGRL